MKALLDVNVLIALLDVDHVHHIASRTWLDQHIDEGWSSCPITENGCIRIMSQPRYPNPLSIGDVVSRLNEATSTQYHSFVTDNVSLLDGGLIDHRRLLSPRQLTDVYLLALAMKNSSRFVTFDHSIPVAAVKGAKQDVLAVI